LSFGGGGGSTGVTNHVHDNSVGEGGALDSTQTLIDSGLLQTNIRMNALVYG